MSYVPSVLCWPETLRSDVFPRALGSSQGDLFSAGQAGVSGPPAQRPSGPALYVHMVLVCAHGLPSVCSFKGGFPLHRLGWFSWEHTHAVCRGDLDTLQRKKCTFTLTKGCLTLVPAHSQPWPHSVASCDCHMELWQPHTQTAEPALFTGKRRGT